MLQLIITTAMMLGLYQQGHANICTNPIQSSMKLDIVSERNEAGQWNAEVEQQNGKAIITEDENTESWNFILGQSTAHCDGQETVILTATVVAPRPKEIPDYEFHPGVGYYKLHTTAKPWFAARDICIKEGAHLAVINSEQESKVLTEMFRRIIPESKAKLAFIGFKRIDKNQFITVLGDPLDSTGYVRWKEYEPNNALDVENCGTMYGDSGLLNDYHCYNTLPFICEINNSKIRDKIS